MFRTLGPGGADATVARLHEGSFVQWMSVARRSKVCWSVTARVGGWCPRAGQARWLLVSMLLPACRHLAGPALSKRVAVALLVNPFVAVVNKTHHGKLIGMRWPALLGPPLDNLYQSPLDGMTLDPSWPSTMGFPAIVTSDRHRKTSSLAISHRHTAS